MSDSRIDHIGIATPNLDEHSHLWSALGFRQGEDELNTEQGVRIRFFESNTDGARIELLEPLGDSTPIGRFLTKNGPGIQQLAIRVNDIHETISKLTELGVQMINPEPVLGAGGHLIAFIHPRSTGGVLVELVGSSE